MTFGLGINQIATTNKWAGIDVSAVNQVSNDIFARAAKVESIDVSKLNLNAFKRAELGVDLYSGKTNVELQKQISLINSGHLQTHAISTTFLNAQAASTLYPPMNVQKALTEEALATTTELVTNNVAKDKKGGANPFMFGHSFNEEIEKPEGLNFVA